MKKLIAMIRKIFSKFIALFAMSHTLAPLATIEDHNNHSPGSPRIRKKPDPGAFGSRPMVANCRKIWRNRHGKHIK